MGTDLASVQAAALDHRPAFDPLQALIDGWLLEYPKPNTKAAYKRELGKLREFVESRGGSMLAVTRAIGAAWGESLRREGLSEATVGRHLSSASSFYQYCAEEDAIPANPLKALRRPKRHVNEDGAAWLNVEQSGAFLRAAHDYSPSAHALAAVMLTTGARVSEVTAVDATDLTHNGGHRLLTVTRKGGARQNLPIAPWVGVVIDRHFDGRTDGPLFTKPRSGQRMDQPAAWRLVRLLAKRAGLPHADRLHPHSLRHTAITTALEAGAGLREVQRMAGHVDPRTTERYDQMRESLDKSPVYLIASTLAE